jgi:hypothetical protein
MVRSPVEICFGTSPSQAPKSRPRANNHDWLREPSEPFEAFRERVMADARAAGLKHVTFGALPLPPHDGDLDNWIFRPLLEDYHDKFR